MKRKIFIDGHLGMNPEEKTTTNGTKYVTFRLANHCYGDAEDVTYWFTVTVWDAALQKWCMNNLKKGSFVEVYGQYTDRVYVSNKTNQAEIGRDITARDVAFCGAPRREDDAQAGQTAPAQAAPESAPVPEAGAPKAQPMPEAPVADAPADDDLPF